MHHHAAPFAYAAPSPVPFLAGLSDDRLARVAARLAFVEMKSSFIRAAAHVPGAGGTLLQRKVRLSTDVADLWRLRAALFEQLPLGDPTCAAIREEMQYHLDSAHLPGDAEPTSFQP